MKYKYKIEFAIKLANIELENDGKIEGFVTVTASNRKSAINAAKKKFKEALKQSTESSFEIIEYYQIH